MLKWTINGDANKFEKVTMLLQGKQYIVHLAKALLTKRYGDIGNINGPLSTVHQL